MQQWSSRGTLLPEIFLVVDHAAQLVGSDFLLGPSDNFRSTVRG